MTLQEKMNTLKQTLSSFHDWSLKYEYIIDMGKSAPAFPQEYKTDIYKISGCQSQVWLHINVVGGLLKVDVDADSLIAKGIASLLANLVNDVTPHEVVEANVLEFCKDIGLLSNLSPTRAHGLSSMVTTIINFAKTTL